MLSEATPPCQDRVWSSGDLGGCWQVTLDSTCEENPAHAGYWTRHRVLHPTTVACHQLYTNESQSPCLSSCLSNVDVLIGLPVCQGHRRHPSALYSGTVLLSLVCWLSVQPALLGLLCLEGLCREDGSGCPAQ